MKKPTPILLVIASILLLGCSLAAKDVNIADTGAVGDGKTLNTSAIQQAIDQCHSSGGGTVYFPQGRFMSGFLTLKSNVTLHLSTGAVLLCSPSLKDFSKLHLIYADHAENIAIEGRGTIDGNGRAYRDENFQPLRPRPSPLIEIRNSHRIRIENVTILNAPAWTIHPKNCDDVQIRGILLLNEIALVNTDGIDIDSSRNVIISDCRIEAGDDCIVIKTTRWPADEPAQPVENVVVTNCILVSAASALKLGTESHGDFRHIVFSNCVIRDSRTGLALFCKDGGTMEDIRFSNIVMTIKPKWGKGYEWPILVDLERRTGESAYGAIRDVFFSDITLYTQGRITVTGIPERAIENVGFSNIRYCVTGYEEIEKATKLRGGAGQGAPGTPLYPTVPAMFILAHVDGITLDNVVLTWPKADPAKPAPLRHVIGGENVKRSLFRDIQATASQPSAPMSTLKTP